MPNKDLKKEAKEKLEILAPKETREGLRALGEAAKEVQEMDINSPYTLAMANVDVKKPLPEDKEGLTFMESEVINIVSKIAKKHPKASLSRITPENLSSIAQKSGIKLRSSEVVALRKLDEIRLDPTSPLAEELEMIWPLLIEKAEEARMGLTEKYLKNLKKRPAETIIYTGAAIAGIYLGYKLIKWLAGKGKEKVEKKVSKFFSTGNILAFLGLGAFGTYMGSDSLKEWLAETFGFKDERDKLKKLIEKLRKARDPEEIKRLKKKVKDLAQKLQKVPEKVKKGAKLAKRIKEEKEWALAGREVPPEEKEKYTKFSEMIGKVDPNRKVSAVFFAVLDPNKKYEDFLKEPHGFFERVKEMVRYARGDVKRNIENLTKIVKEGNYIKLHKFFTNMLKNNGEFEEFKGKTIIEVMEMIQEDYKKGGDKYIDEEAKKGAYIEYESSKKTMERLGELAINPLLLADTEYAAEFLADLSIAGYTIVIPKLKTVGVWIVDNFGAAVFWESKVAYKYLNKLADHIMENSDDPLWDLAGLYCQAGAFTVAIGAPIGTVAGFAKGLRGGFGQALRSAVRGTIGGAWRGFTIPGKLLLKGLTVPVDLARHQFHPLRDIRGAINQHLFFIEDLRLGIWGDKFGWKTWTERILNGEIEINKRVIDKLATYESIATAKKNKMDKLAATKTRKKKVHQDWAKRYQRMQKQIEKLTKFWDGTNEVFIADKWNKRMMGIKNNFELSDETYKLLEITADEKTLNRLGVILLDEEHPITRFIAKNKGEKANQFLKLINSNEEILNGFARHPNLINDYRVVAALEQLEAKTAATCEHIISERAKIWNNLRAKELRLLDKKPDLIPSYTKLIDQIQKAKYGRGIESRLLRRIILNSKSRRAQFIYKYIHQLDVLFEPTASGRRAVEQFLAIDEKVFKTMEKAMKKSKVKGFNPFKELAEALSKNEEAVLKVISEYEQKAGMSGRMASRLNEMKAGNFDKVRKGIEGKQRLLDKSTTSKILKKAQSDLMAIGKKVNKARKALETAEKTGKGIEEAKIALSQAEEAQRAAQKVIEDLKLIQKSQKAMEGVKVGSREAIELGRRLGDAQEAAEDSIKIASEAFERVGHASKLSKLWKALRWAGKWGGRVGGVFGAGVSGIEAVSSAYEAFTTEVPGRAGIEAANAIMWTANGTVDGALALSLFGKGGAVAKVAGRIWLPVGIATYAGNAMYDTWKEETLTEAEWAQRYSYDEMIHQWFSTYSTVSFGDALWTGFGFDTIEESMQYKAKNMHKMYRVLIAGQKNPKLLTLVVSEEPSKNQKINEIIDSAYTKYHEYYFQNSQPALLKNYNSAQRFIAEAEMFNFIMQQRDALKKQGVKEFRIGLINLMDERYEITGTKLKPQVKRHFSPDGLVKAYEKQIMMPFEQVPNLNENLESMETPYLLRLYVQSLEMLKEFQKGKLELDAETINSLRGHLILLRLHLTIKRGVNIGYAILRPEFFKPKMDSEEILTHLKNLSSEEVLSYKVYERKNIEIKPGVRAIYKLAQYFGYNGHQKEEDLKAFFIEEKANFHGIYWDGEEWMVQQAGSEPDVSMGPTLNYITISKIVGELYEYANDIIENRHDRWVANAYDYTHQVQKMAEIVQEGYNEGVDEYTPGQKTIGYIAPKWFETKEPKGTENFVQEYSNEINRLKETTNWDQLLFEVKDKNTIILSRTDTAEKTTITKPGTQWNIENFATDLTFDQAVAMGNMLNYAKKTVAEGRWRGGDLRPFEIDGKNIDFDKAGWPFDTKFIDGDRHGNWMDLFKKIDVTQQMLIDMLNNWYSSKHQYVAA